MKESLRSDLISGVELYRTRQQRHSLLPLSQLELTLGLVKARSTRLSQLFLQFFSDFCLRCQCSLGARFCCSGRGGIVLSTFTLVLSLEPLKTGNDRESADRGH